MFVDKKAFRRILKIYKLWLCEVFSIFLELPGRTWFGQFDMGQDTSDEYKYMILIIFIKKD